MCGRYLGLYDLTVPSDGADGTGMTEYHLVIMANVFETNLPITERFDLKGSTHHRTVGKRRADTLPHSELLIVLIQQSINETCRARSAVLVGPLLAILTVRLLVGDNL